MAYAWFALILLCLVLYVTLDGYDLGIGSLTLVERDRGRQREMLEIVATAWDGNESWIILLAVTTWAGLPLAYATMLPALYLPLLLMLWSLVVRGVALEMVSRSGGMPRGWSLLFGLGSLTAGFAQGVVIGGLLSGVRVVDRQFAGGTFDFFTPYAVLTGLATTLLYALAGSAVLRLKGEGGIRSRAGVRGRVLLGFTAALTLVSALALPSTAAPLHLDPAPRALAVVVLVLFAVGGFALAWTGFGGRHDGRPVVGVALAEVAGLLALVTLVAPTVVPPGITIAEARSPGHTFVFLFVGVGLNVPLLLFYSWYAHHVFRGKYRVPADQRPQGLSATGMALLPVPLRPGGAGPSGSRPEERP